MGRRTFLTFDLYEHGGIKSSLYLHDTSDNVRYAYILWNKGIPHGECLENW